MECRPAAGYLATSVIVKFLLDFSRIYNINIVNIISYHFGFCYSVDTDTGIFVQTNTVHG